eukprot:7389288-Prymnesium_polylepis.4
MPFEARPSTVAAAEPRRGSKATGRTSIGERSPKRARRSPRAHDAALLGRKVCGVGESSRGTHNGRWGATRALRRAQTRVKTHRPRAQAPDGHGLGFRVAAGHQLPAGLCAGTHKWSDLLKVTVVKRWHDSHHGREHPGPDCSSGLVPPTVPAAHAYGNDKSSAPGGSLKMTPWRTFSHRPGGAGSVYCRLPLDERYTELPARSGAELCSKNVWLSRCTRPLSICLQGRKGENVGTPKHVQFANRVRRGSRGAFTHADLHCPSARLRSIRNERGPVDRHIGVAINEHRRASQRTTIPNGTCDQKQSCCMDPDGARQMTAERGILQGNGSSLNRQRSAVACGEDTPVAYARLDAAA